MLQTVGENDMPVFLDAAPYFRSDYAESLEFRHSGAHVYPTLTPGLKNKIRELLKRSELTVNTYSRI